MPRPPKKPEAKGESAASAKPARKKKTSLPRELKAARAARAEKVFDLLLDEYPDAHCELDHANPFQLAVSTILSAQTTDVRVNMVTPELFRRYPDAEALANAAQEDVEELVRTTGFFRNKARNIIGFARALMGDHGGVVPRTIDELAALPGVGRKTANVVLGNAFGINEGVVVDTHIRRLSTLLAFTKEKTPEKIEQDLMVVFPSDRWTLLAHLLIWHGRRVCYARNPRCEGCAIEHLCPSSRA